MIACIISFVQEEVSVYGLQKICSNGKKKNPFLILYPGRYRPLKVLPTISGRRIFHFIKDNITCITLYLLLEKTLPALAWPPIKHWILPLPILNGPIMVK